MYNSSVRIQHIHIIHTRYISYEVHASILLALCNRHSSYEKRVRGIAREIMFAFRRPEVYLGIHGQQFVWLFLWPSRNNLSPTFVIRSFYSDLSGYSP